MMGCVISDEVVAHINNLLASMPGKNVDEAFKEGRYMFKYQVPTENGHEDLFCLNWVSTFVENIDRIDIDYMVNDAFSMHNKKIDAEDVKMKIANTIKFIRHCALK